MIFCQVAFIAVLWAPPFPPFCLGFCKCNWWHCHLATICVVTSSNNYLFQLSFIFFILYPFFNFLLSFLKVVLQLFSLWSYIPSRVLSVGWPPLGCSSSSTFFVNGSDDVVIILQLLSLLQVSLNPCLKWAQLIIKKT